MRISDWSSDVCSSDLGSILSSCGQMERRRECRKPEHILERLAISPNTGDKLWLGEGIRASGTRRLTEGLKEEFNNFKQRRIIMAVISGDGVFSHACLGGSDLAKSQAFSDAALRPLGLSNHGPFRETKLLYVTDKPELLSLKLRWQRAGKGKN